ncbi:glycosyltransferase [Ferruginibacter yonginensis]|uniref:Glycosyltransferase n=1 Tax=Ferruginibacter yonginensis TaxID=1310416 RepID=A0ABV8QLU7_9BACT
MKILIVMDPGILIPVQGYGGHERLVDMFAQAYQQMGHEVDLLITNGSTVPGCRVYGYGKVGFPPTKKDAQKAIFTAWRFLWKRRKQYDLIHNFGRLLYLLPVLPFKVKKIMTYGREITSGNIRMIQRLPHRQLVFTGCSTNLIERAGVTGNWHTVYNAIQFNKYQLVPIVAVDAPLMFLGRIEKVKGCHTAIAVAKATQQRLVIAGNVSPLADEQAYFDTEIAPHIDGTQIQYIGAVNDAQKNEWLGKAKALLMPIEWNEPFGIVMIEAMACGTPVIAFEKGSVTEVVDEGITGFKVAHTEGMIAALEQLSEFDRTACRQHAAARFDAKVIAQQYLSLHASATPTN